MNTETEIRVKGMQALIGVLGLVDAERFMAASSRDRFNYTEWRRLGLPAMALKDLAAADEGAIVLAGYLREAYTEAEAFSQLLQQRVRGAGFFKILLLRRLGSSMEAGRRTIAKLLGDEPDTPDDEDEDDAEEEAPTQLGRPPQGVSDFKNFTDAEITALRRCLDLLKQGGSNDPKPGGADRLVLKSAKPLVLTRLAEFRASLEAHQAVVAADLQTHLDTSRQQIVDYYKPRVIEARPDALLGQSLNEEISEDAAKRWLNWELDRVFPKAADLIQGMKLDERYKDVTFETLNREDFLESVKEAFPNVDWDKAYKEFKAAGQSENKDPVPK